MPNSVPVGGSAGRTSARPHAAGPAVREAVEGIGRPEFTLAEVYAAEVRLAAVSGQQQCPPQDQAAAAGAPRPGLARVRRVRTVPADHLNFFAFVIPGQAAKPRRPRDPAARDSANLSGAPPLPPFRLR